LGQSWLKKNKLVLVALGAFTVLAIVIVMVFFAIKMVNNSKNKPEPEQNQPIVASSSENVPTPTTSPISSLPTSGEITTGSNGGTSSSTALAAQKIYFGDYYQPIKEEIQLNPPVFSLPLNVKTEVANYYDVYRKINLDAGLENLNSNGFAVLDNPFSSEADNFYKMYDLLEAKAVPTLITSDFLIYYYQNVLKLAYKDIESSVFYDNLWETNKRLYQTAKERYEKNLEQKGLINDISLEGSRLEAAYFATALILLAPTDEQITKDSGLSKTAGFSPAEAEVYSFQLPAYLSDDVGREIKLIREAKDIDKSPVLIYARDYKNFSIPEAYKNNARLNNFYLASVWLNSVFPLYYRDAACLNCLLDINDWRINMFTSFLIAEDFSANQELQNRWAKIYKLQSFFGGLRNDLNYLNYQDVLSANFGSDKKIGEILGGTSEEIDKNLFKLREKLSQIIFAPIEGGLDKTATDTKPMLGMKMLVSSYSPDNYIFGELTYPKVGLFLGSEKDAAGTATACNLRGQEGYYRCRSSAFDIANLIFPLKNNSLFSLNTNYQDYGVRAGKLSSELASFTASSWHNHSYWTVLDIAGKMLSAPEKTKIVFMNNGAWQAKDLNTAIASWANAQLPADIFAPHESTDSIRLNQTGGENPYSAYKYIEPNLTLSRELLANTRMISEVLTLINVSNGGNNVLLDLKNLQKNLESTEAIIKKELQNEGLSEEDYIFTSNFVREFSVKETGNKILQLPAAIGAGFKENLTGVKLLILAYQRGDKKLFVAGPVFNYREEKK